MARDNGHLLLLLVKVPRQNLAEMAGASGNYDAKGFRSHRIDSV
jgi:hypothetical protein